MSPLPPQTSGHQTTAMERQVWDYEHSCFFLPLLPKDREGELMLIQTEQQ